MHVTGADGCHPTVAIVTWYPSGGFLHLYTVIFIAGSSAETWVLLSGDHQSCKYTVGTRLPVPRPHENRVRDLSINIVFDGKKKMGQLFGIFLRVPSEREHLFNGRQGSRVVLPVLATFAGVELHACDLCKPSGYCLAYRKPVIA